MNSNLFHNISNVLTVLLAVLTAVLLATGCVGDFTTQTIADCSASWVDARWTAITIAVLGGLKIVVNVIRDGVGGLIKPQPPVKK